MKHLSTQSAEITYTLELTESELMAILQVYKKHAPAKFNEYQLSVFNNLEKLVYTPKTVNTVGYMGESVKPMSNLFPPEPAANPQN